MNVQKVVSPIEKNLYSLKQEHTTLLLMGRVKQARSVYREYAKLAVDNFELATKVPNPIKGKVPLFSYYGINCLKYMICSLFTRKTPEEKQLKQMAKEYKIKQKILK